MRHPWIVTNAPFTPVLSVMNEIITNMIDCKLENKVQEGILSMICHRSINREDLENLELGFLTLDTDCDGLISF